MADGILISPGSRLDPGDVFLDIPFPTMKWPLEAFRLYPKHAVEKMGTPYLPVNSTELKGGDIVKVGVSRKAVMLVSDGCAIDRILDYHRDSSHKRHWLVAPLDKVSTPGEVKQQDKLRQGLQPNKFYLGADHRLGDEEWFADLRRITPINCAYFFEVQDQQVRSRAVCTVAPKFKDDLRAKLLEFFTGLALLSYFECPNCHEAIDSKDLLIPYEDPAED